MHRENPSTLNSLPASHGLHDLSFDQQSTDESPAPDIPDVSSDVGGMFGKHKGKMAVGAAAMLGIAIFYKWREHRLAKDDPEEYARLQRLKQAVKNEKRTHKEP